MRTHARYQRRKDLRSGQESRGEAVVVRKRRSERRRLKSRAYFKRRFARALVKRTFWNSPFGLYLMSVWRRTRHLFDRPTRRGLQASALVQWSLLSHENRRPFWVESRSMRRIGVQPDDQSCAPWLFLTPCGFRDGISLNLFFNGMAWSTKQ